MIKTVTITGGSGYLAKILADRLSSSGHRVRLASRSLPTPQASQSISPTVQVDWRDDRSIQRACDGADAVVYASGLSALESERDPDRARVVNGINAERTAVFAKRSGVKTYVFLSTVNVYSDNPTTLLTEESPTLNEHPYASSHALGEKLVIALATPQFSVHVLRISNAFGAPVGDFGASRGLVLHDFALQGVNEGVIEFRSPGSTCRDFVPVSYVARVVERLVNPKAGSRQPSIINLTSGETKTLEEAANIFGDAIGDITGFKPRIMGNFTTKDTASRFVFSNKLANRIAPYSASEFADEVNRLIQFIRSGSHG